MFNKITIITLAVIMAILVSACASQQEELPVHHGITTTEVVLEPGDEITQTFGEYPPLTTEDLIGYADTIVVGKVIDILPAKQIQGRADKPTIYTDVIVKVENYLQGKSLSERIAIRTKGGKISNWAVVNTNEAVFDLHEDVVLFLYHPENNPEPPEGISSSDYYAVNAGMIGKFEYRNGDAIGWDGKGLTVFELEQKIISTNGGK